MMPELMAGGGMRASKHKRTKEMEAGLSHPERLYAHRSLDNNALKDPAKHCAKAA